MGTPLVSSSSVGFGAPFSAVFPDGTFEFITTGEIFAAFPDLFCADCSADARAALVASYHPEPGAPLQDKVVIGAGAAGVAKTYIHTSEDRVVSPALQASMVAATPFARELVLETSHAAMLSQPLSSRSTTGIHSTAC